MGDMEMAGAEVAAGLVPQPERFGSGDRPVASGDVDGQGAATRRSAGRATGSHQVVGLSTWMARSATSQRRGARPSGAHAGLVGHPLPSVLPDREPREGGSRDPAAMVAAR